MRAAGVRWNARIAIRRWWRSWSSSISGTNAIPEEFRPLVEKALQMAQASGRVGPLNTIEAIRFYRQATGVGLADAKRVIDAVGPLHVGASKAAGQMQRSVPARSRAGKAGAGCWC